MRGIRTVVAAGLLILLGAGAAWGSAGWGSLRTDHFTVFYQPGYERAAEQALAVLEHYRPAVERLTGNELFHLPVVIEDTGYANGLSNPVFPSIRLFVTPPRPDSGLGFGENWWALVAPHEYIHALSLSKTGGKVAVYRQLFGNLFLPNVWAPGWVLEGITVYGESQLSPYQGRLNDGYYDAYLGARVREGRFPSIVEASHFPREFPTERAYLFGGPFFAYLSRTYGEERFAEFFRVNGSNVESLFNFALPGLGVDAAAREVYGKPFPALWNDWRAYETQRLGGFRMDGERLTRHGWYVQEPRVHGDKLYYKRSYPVQAGPRSYRRNQIVERDLADGRERVLLETTADFALSLQFRGDQLYYAVDEVRTGFANAYEGTLGLEAVVRRRDLVTGTDRAVLRRRMRAFAVLDDGSLLYASDRADGFGSDLRRWSPETGEDCALGPVDYLVEEIAAGEGRLVVTARPEWGNTGIYALDLERLEFTALVDSPAAEFGLSLLGERLYYTSNLGHTYAAHCYDFATRQAFRLTDGGYATHPAYDGRTGRLYYVGLTSAGFDLYAKTPQPVEVPVDTSGLPPVARPDFALDWSRVTRGTYADNLKTLAPAIHLPILEYSSHGGTRFGAVLVGADAVGDFAYRAEFLYDSWNEETTYDLRLASAFWAPLQVSLAADNGEGSGRVAADLSYPLLRRLQPGLSSLAVGLEAEHRGDPAAFETAPYASLDFAWPRTLASLEARVPVREAGAGFAADAGIARNALGGDWSLIVRYRNDEADPDPALPKIRGYSEPWPAGTGETISLGYSRTLCQINRGTWSPSFFLADSYATLFADAAATGAEVRQSSCGGELHLRGEALGSSFDALLRAAVNREGEETFELGLRLSL